MRHSRTLGLSVLCLVTGWIVLGLYALHPVLPFNAVPLPLEQKVLISRWLPQGWNFFTRDPREPAERFYLRDGDGSWVDATLGPNMSRPSLFGLGRRARAQLVESAILIYDIPAREFHECHGAVEHCLEGIDSDRVVANPSPEPTLCGTIGFSFREPVPWAWARSSAQSTTTRVLRIKVKC